ncbi:MAG: hypothetical protein QM766_18360 [Burkholderiaceae bacterium]
MPDLARKLCDPDFDDALRLFVAMHDEPSNRTARALVEWLAECPGHVRVFDDVLTLWALAGGGLAKRFDHSILGEPMAVQ